MSISDNNTRIMVTVSKDEKTKLETIAKEEQRSISNMCAKIIGDFIKKYIESKGEI